MIQKDNFRDYEFLGAHPVNEYATNGVRFSVWAPKAASVHVVGHFNSWHGHNHSMQLNKKSGIWSIFIPGLTVNTIYMYEIITRDCKRLHKIDPFAFCMSVSPNFTSRVTDLNQFEWLDSKWQTDKKNSDRWNRPISIYEVHLGSWQRHSGNKYYSYIELTHSLIDYVKDMGFTHIQLMPVMEHPFDGSWGYQLTGYFSANSRFGHPIDLMYFIDYCHQKQLGVILDWVPGHFSRDRHGLSWYDGYKCYETNSKKTGSSNKWGANDFNYKKNEVLRFLFSSALFWLDKFHIDGIRVDAVSEIVNKGGFYFLQKLNNIIDEQFPGTLMIAEDSSGRKQVTEKSDYGLGFAYRLNLWWTHDTLNYFKGNHYHQRENLHNLLINTLHYAHFENFILSFSHDETAYNRGSLLTKMPGNSNEQFLNMKLLLAWQFAFPGKKLIFMGIETAQKKSWKYNQAIDWGRLRYKKYKLFHDMIKYLNHLYTTETALHQLDKGLSGTYIQSDHAADNTIIIKRMERVPENFIIIAVNFSGKSFNSYYVGVPNGKKYKIIFSTEWSNYKNHPTLFQDIQSEQYQWQNQSYRIKFELPSLSLIMIKPI